MGKKKPGNRKTSSQPQSVPRVLQSPSSDKAQEQEKQNKGITASFSQTTISSHSSPFPPPKVIREYNEIAPDLGTKIIDWVTEQASHRHELEKIHVVSANRRANLGMWLAFVISMSSLFLAAFCIWNNAPGSGATIACSCIGSLAGVYVYGKHTSHSELMKKAEQVPKIENTNQK